MKDINDHNVWDQIEYIEKPWKYNAKIKKRNKQEKQRIVEDYNPVISKVTMCDIPVNMDVTGT